MIKKEIAERVLTIGPDPQGKGGIASVIKYYQDEVYSVMNFVPEAKAGSNKALKLLQALQACTKLVYTLKRRPEIAVVHLHSATKVSFPRSCVFMNIAKRMGRKVVLHMHGGEFPRYCAGREAEVSAKLAKADMLIALSESWRHYYTSTLGVHNVEVVPNIVATPAPSFSVQAREQLPQVHALFLGLLDEMKGIFDLLEAISRVKDALIGKFILHVGGNGDADRFVAAVDTLGLGDIVKFEGWISGDRKRELLERSSISILPSYKEGLPISLLEGMAHRHALISTKVGGIPEILDSSNGAILDPGDIEGLAQALSSLTLNRDTLRDFGEESYRRVSPHLPDQVSESLSDIYTNLLR